MAKESSKMQRSSPVIFDCVHICSATDQCKHAPWFSPHCRLKKRRKALIGFRLEVCSGSMKKANNFLAIFVICQSTDIQMHWGHTIRYRLSIHIGPFFGEAPFDNLGLTRGNS
jgi:hypothetical protein